MRIWLAFAATLFVVNSVVDVAVAQDAADPQRSPPQRELLKPPKKGQVGSPISDRFALRISYFAPTVETMLRLDRSNGQPGTELKVEDDLGLTDKPKQARMEMIIRLRERNRLRVDYFKLTRYGNEVLTRTINFGDSTFLVNDRAETSIDYRSLNLTYTRSLFYYDRFELGAGVGISLIETRAKGEVKARNVNESNDGVAPYPTFALDTTWRISKRWSFNARGQRLAAHLDDFSGSLSEYHGDFQYRWRRNFTFGLGYTSLRLVAQSTSTDNLPGRLNQDVSGPDFFIRASF